MTKLTDEELDNITGGNFGQLPYDTVYMCTLTGYYWANPQGTGPAYNLYTGRQLKVAYKNVSGPAPYCLLNGNSPIGWTTRNNFDLL